MGGLIWLWQSAGAAITRIAGGGAVNKDAMDDAVRRKRKRVMDAVVWAVGSGSTR